MSPSPASGAAVAQLVPPSRRADVADGPLARSTVSVALCTFNGARYLPEQLASILDQSRRPDQIVICDDASDDGSLEIAQRMLEGSRIDHRLVKNPVRLGVSGNYARALGLCEHEIVAFSDQDDVWHADKLSCLEAALARSPDVAAVFSDARAIDASGRPLGFSQWQACWFGSRVRAAYRADLFPLLVRYPVVCGATLAVRRAQALRCLPIAEGWLHDEWIALTSAATSRVQFLETVLLDYRVHDTQSVGLVRPTLRSRIKEARRLDQAYFEAQVRRFTLLAERLEQWTPAPPKAVLSTLARKLAFLRRRALIRGGAANPWITATGQLLDGSHHRYGHGFKSWLVDVGYDLVYRRERA